MKAEQRRMHREAENRVDAACVTDLAVGTLRDIVVGQLRHGEMPAIDGDDAPVGRIVRDASLIERGDVFWAKDGTPGDRCASEFAYEALMRGAAGVIANCHVEPWSGRWSLEVPDTSRALSKLADWNRARFTGRTIAVSGSVGKTTTLAMIEAILRTRLTGKASSTGVRDRVLGAREQIEREVLDLEPLDDFALFEFPSGGLASLAGLAEVCRPEVAVVTNLADAPWAGFESRMAIAESHRKLLAELPVGGVAVLPGDDPWVRRFAAGRSAAGLAAPIVLFGRGGDCDIRATDVECRGDSLQFSVDGVRIAVPVSGRHLLDCCLAAYAVGRFMNFSPHEIADALAEFRPLPHRCNVLGVRGRRARGKEDFRNDEAARMNISARFPDSPIALIDDSQGHNPAATRAALQLLRDFHASGRRMAVLGDVDNAGGQAAIAHQQLGEEVVSLCGPDLLVACGKHADQLVAGAVAAGMPTRLVVSVQEAGEAALVLNRELSRGDVVLIHGRPRFCVSHFLDQLGAGAETRAA
jgi:UDP-N-acetylmuramoyl-tripeptide--D-alanyl-D-alanine ligase